MKLTLNILTLSLIIASCLFIGGQLRGFRLEKQFLTVCTEGNSEEPGLPLETCQKFWDHVRAK